MWTDLKESFEALYIYGTGLWARNVFHSLRDKTIFADGFLVTRKEGNPEELYGLPVREFSADAFRNAGIILGLNQHNAEEVRKYLLENSFPNERILTVKDIMNVDDCRVGYDEIPCIDVTARVGCTVNCRYCPQTSFLSRYFEGNIERASVLTEEVFHKCLENLPPEANIQFGGFAEVFLNVNSISLIKMACDTGRHVNLYTTLVGLGEEKLRELLELPIEYVTLHVADEKGYAHIPLTNEYYHILEKVIHAVRADGKPLVDMCNAQDKPDSRVLEICKDHYEISYSLIDRAGNLEGKSLVRKRLESGAIYCGVCGDALNKNELLPDGTLLLCCMDYGMKHVLGNLYDQTYEEIMQSDEIKRIRNGLREESSDEILCRKCSCANIKEMD